MIMVEVQIPVLDRKYDFKLDEYAEISVLIEEIVEMVCIKEQNTIGGDEKQLMLFDINTACVLEKFENLHNYGIRNGDRLILV